jgi:hypothetical protein
MCVFCAAIPSVAALGTAAHGKQRQTEKQAEVENKPVPKRKPIAKSAAALMVMLVVASALYHTQEVSGQWFGVAG